MQIRSPTPCASRSRDSASGSASRGSSPPWRASGTASALNRTREGGDVERAPGLSVRLKLTFSYAGFLMVAGFLMLAAAWLAGQPGRSFDSLLRYVPDDVVSTLGGLVPGNDSFLLRAFAPAAAIALAFLLVFGLLGGWLLAGRMLAPLTRITDATRMAANGSLSHRVQL